MEAFILSWAYAIPVGAVAIALIVGWYNIFRFIFLAGIFLLLFPGLLLNHQSPLVAARDLLKKGNTNESHRKIRTREEKRTQKGQ